ncbi:MAG: hypothetical protein K0S39_3116 [Paenibacillus sp.]|nr:hypothetical protein [Paenibacillus sp.]
MNLSLEPVRLLIQQLDKAGIRYASGGSGLLYSLGLTDEVRDWDLTTDAAYEEIEAALQGWVWAVSTSGDYPFASSFRMTIADERLPIDLIGRFAIHSEKGICRMPAISPFEWQRIRMGSPEVWAVAYALMDRNAKANKLFTYLQDHGANRDTLQRLLSEPLPDSLRLRLLGLL